MKKILLIAFLLLTAMAVFAQTPQKFNYQAVPRNLSGIPITNTQISLQMSILEDGPNGTSVYAERHFLNTGPLGLANVQIGGGQVVSGTFDAINWATGNKWLKVEMDPVGGNNFQPLSSLELLTVPFALFAESARNATQVSLEALTDVNTAGAAVGQVLKWNGSTWEPAPDITAPNYNAGNGILIVGNTIVNAGDTNPNDDVTLSFVAAGDVTGNLQNLQIAPATVGGTELQDAAVQSAKLANGAVLKQHLADQSVSREKLAPKSVDSMQMADGAVHKQHLAEQSVSREKLAPKSVDSMQMADGAVHKQHLAEQSVSKEKLAPKSVDSMQMAESAVHNQHLAQQSVSEEKLKDGAATTPKIANGAVTGQKLAPMGAAIGQALKWDGTLWVPSDDNGQNYVQGAGVQIAGNVIANTGDINPADDIVIGTPAGGDFTGTFPNPTLHAIKGKIVSDLPPQPYPKDVLKFNGVTDQWEASPDIGQDYVPGAGVQITGATITNTGDINPADDIIIGTTAGGDFTGTYPNPTLNAIKGKIVSNLPPINGHILKYNGGSNQWEPSPDVGKDYVAGAGIQIAGSTISNIGDSDNNPTNEIQTLGLAGNVLSLTPSGGSVNLSNVGSPQWALTSDDIHNTNAGGVAVNISDPGFYALKVKNKSGYGFDLETSANANDWEFYVTSGTSGNLELYYNSALRGSFNSATGNYVPGSDRRLKKNIQPLYSVLDRLVQLQPVSYQLKAENPQDQTTLGFIAQEVEPLFPELVEKTEDRNGGTSIFGLNYSGFGVIAVKAIQEQQAQIEALKKDNEMFKNQNAALVARMAELERMVGELAKKDK